MQRLGKSMWNGAGERTNLRLEEKHLQRILDATQNEIEHLSVNPMDLSILCNQHANASEMHKQKTLRFTASLLLPSWRCYDSQAEHESGHVDRDATGQIQYSSSNGRFHVNEGLQLKCEIFLDTFTHYFIQIP